jgi:hypothetical protein
MSLPALVPVRSNNLFGRLTRPAPFACFLDETDDVTGQTGEPKVIA